MIRIVKRTLQMPKFANVILSRRSFSFTENVPPRRTGANLGPRMRPALVWVCFVLAGFLSAPALDADSSSDDVVDAIWLGGDGD